MLLQSLGISQKAHRFTKAPLLTWEACIENKGVVRYPLPLRDWEPRWPPPKSLLFDDDATGGSRWERQVA